MVAISITASFLSGALGVFEDIPFSKIKFLFLSRYSLSILAK